MLPPEIWPSAVVHVYTEVGEGFLTSTSLAPITPQNIGTLAATSTRGARKRSSGATKSFNSAVKEDDARVFTTMRLNGDPQISPPNNVTGSRPSLVRFTENSINCFPI